ncbi:MAG: DUF4259 domain-containing protein [Cellulomonadaceae bacterium]|nr:DUF4259 domain-containing protein [Cellulomonadaceae bacterium]
MGAWGTGIFDNDDAADWAYGLADGGIAYLEESLDVVTPNYLEIGEGTGALAAAETVARMLGRGGTSSAYSEDVDAWVATQTDPPPASLVEAALAAVDRVGGEESELAELWAESGDEDGWRASLDDLATRLSS